MAFKMKGFPMNGDPVEPLKPKQAKSVPNQPGRKEIHGGKDVYPTLAEAREAIHKNRVELIEGGASKQEIKDFDTYQNKRLSELSKKGKS